MWFVLLAIAVAVVIIGGIYFRRRVLWSLSALGWSRRRVRPVGWAIVWLIFGFPLIVFVFVVWSIVNGSNVVSDANHPAIVWLLVLPFWMSMLTMLQSVPFYLAFDIAYLVARKFTNREKISRYRAMACLAIAAIFAIYTPGRIIVERDDLRVRQHQVNANAQAAAHGGNGQSKPLRIAFFADLQQDDFTDQARADEVVQIINNESPDLVLVGGDWINSGPRYIEAAAKTGGMLRSRLGTLSVLGDHEHFAYRDQKRSAKEVSAALAEHGVAMLDNQIRYIEHDGKRIAIICLSYNYIFPTPVDDIRQLIASVEDADFTILLSHQLDARLAALIEKNVDLALAAHTHGGQVNPFVGVTHVSIAGVETKYVDGRYQLGDTTIIVTAGIGFSIAPFRYASPGSIEIIELTL